MITIKLYNLAENIMIIQKSYILFSTKVNLENVNDLYSAWFRERKSWLVRNISQSNSGQLGVVRFDTSWLRTRAIELTLILTIRFSLINDIARYYFEANSLLKNNIKCIPHAPSFKVALKMLYALYYFLFKMLRGFNAVEFINKIVNLLLEMNHGHYSV